MSNLNISHTGSPLFLPGLPGRFQGKVDLFAAVSGQDAVTHGLGNEEVGIHLKETKSINFQALSSAQCLDEKLLVLSKRFISLDNQLCMKSFGMNL